MGFIAWIKKKKELTPIFPSINAVTKEYYSYKEKHPKATHDESLLYAIRWGFNRAFFGSENTFYGRRLFGEFPDNEIIRILKDRGVYDSIGRVATFVAGLELECDEQLEKGIEPSTWVIAKHKFNSFGSPWIPETIEEMESKCWRELEAMGVIIKSKQTKLS